MGTRNLTIVKSKGKTKVAQYCQWDGYPTGQGDTIAKFLKNADLKKFTENIDALEVYTDKEVRKLWEEAGAKGEWISMEVSNKLEQAHPELSRNTGANVLHLIYSGAVKKVKLDEDFKEDKIWCEYCYVIDLDKKTVQMNGGKKYSFKQWTKAGLMGLLEDKDN